MTRSRTGWGRFNPWDRQEPQAARTDRPRRRARRGNFRTLKVPTGRRRGEETPTTLGYDTPNRPPRRLTPNSQEKKGPAFQPAQECAPGRPELEDEPHLEAESARVLEAVGKTFPAIEDLVGRIGICEIVVAGQERLVVRRPVG